MVDFVDGVTDTREAVELTRAVCGARIIIIVIDTQVQTARVRVALVVVIVPVVAN